MNAAPRTRAAQIAQEKAYLANLLPLPWTVQWDYGVFFVPPCEDGREFSLTEIESKQTSMDLGDNRKQTNTVFAADIADDLARYCNADAGADSFLGVIVCGPEGPTKQELKEARTKIRNYFEHLIVNADMEWSRSHSMMFITDLARLAAKWLNVEESHPWVTVIQDLQVCPGCGSRILAGVAKCKECGAILDKAKAVELGLIPAEPKHEKRPQA